MESVLLKVKEGKVKVVHESGVVSHVFDEPKDCSVFEQYLKEVKEMDIDLHDVEDVVYL